MVVMLSDDERARFDAIVAGLPTDRRQRRLARKIVASRRAARRTGPGTRRQRQAAVEQYGWLAAHVPWLRGLVVAAQRRLGARGF